MDVTSVLHTSTTENYLLFIIYLIITFIILSWGHVLQLLIKVTRETL